MELLIRVVHKQPVDSELHDVSSQCGDVIACVPDGWEWSPAERENPDWIIVHCGLVDVEAGALLESGRVDETQWRRRIGINVDELTSGDILTRAQLIVRTF